MESNRVFSFDTTTCPLLTNLSLPLGARYQIKCSDCEVKSYKVHDAMHMFIKLPRPVDVASPLESEFAIIPTLFVGGQYD